MREILTNSLFEAFATASETVYIYVCDMASGVARWSPNAVDYFNLKGEYLENADVTWLANIHPDDQALYLEDITAVMSGRKNHHDCQYRAINKYGDYVWLECKGSVIKGKDGEGDVFAGLMTRLDNQNKYDSLTGLRTFYDFHQVDFSHREGALMLIGLDEFRKIVSSHGYNAGDRVLVQFAKFLMSLADEHTVSYRFSGDEFLILKEHADEAQMRDLFHQIQNAASSLSLGDHITLDVSISGGLTFYPQDGSSREKLINNLEHSLEFSKKKQRGSITVFASEIAAMQKRSQTLREELKKSIENDFQGFQLYFQPIVSAKIGIINGCEALLRWKGETIKDSYPMEFINILEMNGDIGAVGTWVMEQSLLHLKRWRALYPDFHMGFNVSYQQFLDPEFIDHTVRFTKELELDPRQITIELTESSSIDDPRELAEIFTRLHHEGFLLALDDFGTAYASLELLKYLPVNLIKIEHSFVNQLAQPDNKVDYTIISGILSLCRELGCQSVVEGIENKEILNIIKTIDPTFLQGYYYSRPIPEDEFLQLMEDNHSGKIKF